MPAYSKPVLPPDSEDPNNLGSVTRAYGWTGTRSAPLVLVETTSTDVINMGRALRRSIGQAGYGGLPQLHVLGEGVITPL